MAATLFLLVIFTSFHSVLPSTIEDRTRIFRNCLPLNCGNTERINLFSSVITRPLSGEPFSVVRCDDGPPFNSPLTAGVGVKLYDYQSISNVSLRFITENKEFQRQLNSTFCNSFNNLSLPSLHDAASHVLSGLAVFTCNRSVVYSSGMECRNVSIHYIRKIENLPTLPPYCSAVNLQVNSSNYDEIFGLITARVAYEEDMRITCHNCLSEGRKCDTECVRANETEVVEQEPEGPKVAGEGGNNTEKWIILAPSAAGVGILVIALYCCARRFSSYKSKDDNGIELFLKNYGSSAPKRYSYPEVKKMTRSFKDRLGQGGYGSVFKGKLPDGCLVAVKVLKESKSNGAEFINEVASISRTSHVNIVTLLGFCFDGSKQILIYEFIHNGSLEKYIYKENAAIDDHQLDCEKLYEIALGIARGLEYLHRGCNTKILHFDIKPHNILLDENFCPKISDFGLAKICPKRESKVSMMDARGTIGYIAPEVFCRNFGGVSHKSDVYSYGMLVLEMIGGRRSPGVVVDNTSEIYFPGWIHKRLELGEELRLPGTSSEEENNLARKMALVSLWCIQTDPSNRPPVNRVVEMLQASLESLPIPPNPCLSSPSRAPAISLASSGILSSEPLDSQRS